MAEGGAVATRLGEVEDAADPPEGVVGMGGGTEMIVIDMIEGPLATRALAHPGAGTVIKP